MDEDALIEQMVRFIRRYGIKALMEIVMKAIDKTNEK